MVLHVHAFYAYKFYLKYISMYTIEIKYLFTLFHNGYESSSSNKMMFACIMLELGGIFVYIDVEKMNSKHKVVYIFTFLYFRENIFYLVNCTSSINPETGVR